MDFYFDPDFFDYCDFWIRSRFQKLFELKLQSMRLKGLVQIAEIGLPGDALILQ